MAMATQHTTQDSDSEDDPDYVPHADADSGSSDDELGTIAVQADDKPQLTEEEEIAKKKAREALWSDFQASVSTLPPPKTAEPTLKTVKIEKRYLFAGKEVIEVTEVAEDSPDAKRWPPWQPAQDNDSAAISAEPSCLETEASLSAPVESKPTLKPAKRPGPRKPKTSLAALPTPHKAKKLTTLDKSAMDWSAHINAEKDSGMKDQLEANRRGGGYLEKVEFLRRVDERKEDVLDANKSNKRRKL